MRITGESSYGDSMETMLYNTILGALPILPDGTSFYYADYNTNATKTYNDSKWPCCSGTFPQLTADYGISSYLYDQRGIYVNLFVPSRVTWKQGTARVTMTQQTNYPAANESALVMEMDRAQRFAVCLRVPAWAGRQTRVSVNGKLFATDPQPGTWLRIDHGWKNGDRIEFSLDMPLRLQPLDPHHPNLVALMRGPVALFAIEPGTKAPTRPQMLQARQTGPASSDWDVTTDQGKLLLKPYPAITTEHYRLYQEV